MAERELIRVKLLTYLAERIGQEFHAIIIGVEDFGFFCRLVEFPVEGLVHVTSLADDFYYLESQTHTLIGRRTGHRHRLGDRILVRVAHVDVDRRQLDLVLAETPLSRAPRSRRGSEGQPGEIPSPSAARGAGASPRRGKGAASSSMRSGAPRPRVTEAERPAPKKAKKKASSKRKAAKKSKRSRKS
jgi:ribonuclease R